MDVESAKKRLFSAVAIAIFLAVTVISLLLSWLGLFTFDFLILLAAAIVLILMWKSEFFGHMILELKDYERALIFRFGKFNRVGGPGWVLMIPLIESSKHVDLRTRTLDVKKQFVITKDSIEIEVDSVVYLRVNKDDKSVAASVIEVENFEEASRIYIVSSLRDIMGGMDCAEIIANVDKINEFLYEALESIAKDWGVKIVAVQIKNVDLPNVVMNAMHAQKAALQEKLARMERAEAQKIEITAVKNAANTLNDRALNYYYLKALEKMSDGKSTKIIFPMQFSELARSITGKISQNNPDQLMPLVRKALEINIDKAVKKAKK